MSTPTKSPNDRLTPAETRALADELVELRIRAEHGLLRRLVAQAEGMPMTANEAAAGLQALAAAR